MLGGDEDVYVLYLCCGTGAYLAEVLRRIAAIWAYKLGGYQVLKKWLSYREYAVLGRVLTPEEVRYFECPQVAGVLAKFYGNQVNRLTQTAILVRTPLRLQLRHRPAHRRHLDHLDLE